MEQANNFEFNFELFFNLHVDPLTVININGYIIKANRVWEEDLGYNSEELVNKHISDFIHPEDRHTISEALESYQSGINVLIFSNRLLHKNGEYRYLQWNTHYLNGKIFASARDITEIRRQELQLHKDQLRLEAMLETQTNFVVRIDSNLKFSYTNQKYQDKFGWLNNNNTLAGQDALITILPDYVDDLKNYCEKCILTPGEPVQFEIQHFSNTDLPIYVLWECVCLTDGNGEMYEVQGIGIDITERKLIEHKEKERQEFELLEMATPITQLWDGILLLPLVGVVNGQRAQNLTSAVLKKIANTQSKVFILDISGVTVVDTEVANYFIKLAKSTRLMGCLCTISGISAAVAQSIIDLGIQIEQINTTGSMKDALEHGLLATGSKLISLKV